MNKLNVAIAGRLKEKRLEKGFTQKSFSKALGINVATYNKIEAGLGAKADLLEDAAEVLACSFVWLLTGKEIQEEVKNENNQMIALDDQVLRNYLISSFQQHDKIDRILELLENKL